MNKELSANTTLSHYRIVSKIGAGGMGEVYLAEDTKLRRRVALKVLPESIAKDKERLRRFEQEAFAASGLNHPNILTIYEFGAEREAHFLASEFVTGETLRERMTREPLDLRETLDVALQVAAALHAAHAAGIVHRDIKPENIMLRDDRLVKVLDFGLAKLVEKKIEPAESDDETRAMVNTAPGIIMGTVAYMSPEQARGKDSDSRSDIWSLGIVLYEMLAGRAPFAEETVSDTIAAILKSELVPLDENMPAELQRIIKKTLQKNRDERYQTIKDFLLDLKNLKHELEFAEELERSQISNRTNASNVSTNQTGENATAILAAAVSTQNSLPPAASSAEYLVGELKKHKLGAALASLLALTLIGVGAWFFAGRATGGKQIESIAVMPFVNESDNADVEYLSDGMTETLINSLSQLPDLNVKARSSVFRYKGKEFDPKKIASELNVQAILPGRIIQRGDQLTLNLELIAAQTENMLWGSKYERKFSELVVLQNEIARDVSSKLKTKLSGADEQKVTKNYTTNAEANKLYLQGRFYATRRTAKDAQKAIEYLGQAVALDPNYALAYAGLAEAYLFLTLYGDTPPNEAFPKAREAALKALALDNTLAEPHSTLGLILFVDDHDFAGFERHLKRAIELNPNFMDGRRREGLRLLWLGKFEEARAELRQALEIEPLSAVANLSYAVVYFYEGKIGESETLMKKTLELDYNFWITHYYLFKIYRLKENYALAAEELAKVQELRDAPEAARLMRESFAKGGWQGFLRAIAEERARGKLSSYIVASLYAEMGDKNKAFSALNETMEKRDQFIGFLKIDPLMKPLRSDRRFSELLKKAGFPQ